MAGPPWLAVMFAALMIATAAYCVGRLVVSRLRRRATELDADALHAVMGTAMAGMLAPQLNILPGTIWAAVFGTGAAWFGWHAVRTRGPAVSGGTRCRFPVPHLIECVAMLYMLLPVDASRLPGAGGGMAMGGMGASPGSAGSFPALAVVLALFMLGYIVWTTDRLATLTRARSTTADPTTSRDLQPEAIVLSAALPRHADSAVATQAPSMTQRGQPASTPALAPKLAALGKIAMSITMGYMLILML